MEGCTPKLGSDVYELDDEKGVLDGKVHAKDLKLISRAKKNMTNKNPSKTNCGENLKKFSLKKQKKPKKLASGRIKKNRVNGVEKGKNI